MRIKYFYLALTITFFISISVSAQNERSITTRWKVGDKQEYVMEGTTYEITENGDTTLTSRGSMISAFLFLRIIRMGMC